MAAYRPFRICGETAKLGECLRSEPTTFSYVAGVYDRTTLYYYATPSLPSCIGGGQVPLCQPDAVINNSPKRAPVIEAEMDVFEAWSRDPFDEPFRSCRLFDKEISAMTAPQSSHGPRPALQLREPGAPKSKKDGHFPQAFSSSWPKGLAVRERFELGIPVREKAGRVEYIKAGDRRHRLRTEEVSYPRTPQRAIRTGRLAPSIMDLVTPPKMRSRSREWP